MPTYIIIEFICFLSSLLALIVKENRKFLLFFPLFMAATVIVEYLIWDMGRKSQNNLLIVNLFTVFEFAYYLIFLNALIRQFKKNNTLFYLIIIYLCVAVMNIFLFQGKKGFHTYTYILGCMFVVVLCIMYLNYLFRFTKAANLIREPLFWVVTGLLFYYTCSLPIFGILNVIIKIPPSFDKVLIFIINFTNISLYLLFTIGFLCKINFRKLLQ